jgi:LCP family protein required for cell wall assembly
MSGPRPGAEDAQPIPQGGGARGSQLPSSGELDEFGDPLEDPLDEAVEDEVYVVDVRGRKRSASERQTAREPRRAKQARAPQEPKAPKPVREPRPPREPRAPRTRGGSRLTGRRVAGILGLVIAAWLAFMVFTPLHAWNSVAKVDTTPAGERPADGPGYNYLLVGSDSREGLTDAQKQELHTGSAAGRRTDSIILVHVPQGGGKPALISLPRDSYVPIPGHGSNKINAAFAIGGPGLLVATVEQVTDLRIDGYVEIGFAGFSSVVDSLGGVRICVPFDMNDPKAHINLKKGCQELNGPNALGFVRARYSDPRGDIGRAERQRQFLAAIMKKALTPSTVFLPPRYWSFSHAAAQGLIVGQDTSMRDASRVLLAMRAVSSDQALSLVVPLSSLNYQTSAGSAVKWDTARAKALFTLLRNDTPLEAPPEGTDGKPSGN